MENEPQKKSWTDGKERTWEIEVEIGMQKRIKRLLEHDIFDLENAGFHSLMRYDPETAADVLYVTVKPQCDALGLTDLDFAEGCTGDALADGVAAFYTALNFFFQKTAPPKAKILSALMLTLGESLDKAGETAIESLRSEEMKNAVESHLGKATDEMKKRLVNTSAVEYVN